MRLIFGSPIDKPPRYEAMDYPELGFWVGRVHRDIRKETGESDRVYVAYFYRIGLLSRTFEADNWAEALVNAVRMMERAEQGRWRRDNDARAKQGLPKIPYRGDGRQRTQLKKHKLPTDNFGTRTVGLPRWKVKNKRVKDEI